MLVQRLDHPGALPCHLRCKPRCSCSSWARLAYTRQQNRRLSSQPALQPAARQLQRIRYPSRNKMKASVQPLESPSGVSRQIDIPEGTVQVAPLQDFDVAGASVLLSRAFAGSPEALSFNEITMYRAYYRKLLQATDWSKGLVLVARLFPTDASLLPKGRECILIGTMAISFDESTRVLDAYPAPPRDAAYLTNLAVDARFRRRGVASLLLLGGLEGARASGRCQDVYLHVREKDTPALALYQSMGFQSHRRESVPGGIFGMISGRRPQTLMRLALE